MSRRLRASAAGLLGGLALLAGGCVAYRPAPLPDTAALAAPVAPDVERLRVAAAELDHPRLAPVAIDLADGLSPDEAAVLAVLASPDLAAARAAHDESAAQLVAAGLLPRPTLTLERDRPYGSGSEGTVDATNVGLELDLSAMIERSARVAGATAELDSIDLGIAWQEWQVAQSARLHAQRVGWLARRVAVVDAELDSQQRTLEALQAAMEQGDATMSDVGIQLAAIEGLRRSRGELRRSAIEARGELARLLGLPGTAELPVTLSAEAASPLDCAGVDGLIEAAVNGRLDLLALRRGYDAQEAAVRAAVLEQLPGLSVGVVHQRNESALKFLGGYVSLGLPFLGHARAAISLEEATRARLRAEFDARAAGVRADVRGLCATLDELGVQLAGLGVSVDRLEPVAQAEDAAASRGDVDRLSAQAVRSALSDARLELEALRQARAETLTGLQAAIGRPLVADAGRASKGSP